MADSVSKLSAGDDDSSQDELPLRSSTDESKPVSDGQHVASNSDQDEKSLTDPGTGDLTYGHGDSTEALLRQASAADLERLRVVQSEATSKDSSRNPAPFDPKSAFEAPVAGSILGDTDSARINPGSDVTELRTPATKLPLPPSDSAGSDSQQTVTHQINSPSDISPDDLTIISQPPSFEDQKESVSTLEGRRIAHFEIKQFLGGGGMGFVFRAYDTVLSRSVAIKLLPRNGTKPELLQRFQVEARSAARLDHPNISRVFQVGTDEQCDYIIFEYVEGDNLAQLVRRIGPLPLELGLRYAFQLALALQHAYQRGVVHRDVKPANVVVTDGGKLKLIDLGLARSPKANEQDESLTATGVTLGTYDYISPEQARDSRTADVRSDLYSLGCTIFFMFTGQPPYPQGTPIEKIIQHSSEKRPNPADFRTDLPTGFNQITNKLLAINPDDRYQRPAELIAEIQDFASRNNIPLLGYDDNVVVKKIIQKPSWTMQLVPVLIPIALLIGFALYLDYGSEPNQPTGTFFGGEGSIQKADNQAGAASTSPKSNGNLTPPGPEKSKTIDKPGTGSGETKGSGGSGGSAEDSSATPLASNEWIGVGMPPDQITPGITAVESFEEAIETANNNPRIQEIRIFSDRLILKRAVSLRANSNIEVNAAPMKSPLIMMNPDSFDSDYLFKLRSGKITFRGIHFRLNTNKVSRGNLTANPFAIFELDSVAAATFVDGSITLVNLQDDQTRVLDDASFFRIVSQENVAGDETNNGGTPRTSLTMRNMCIRGEAIFLDAREQRPLTFAFNNGLIATDDVLFRFGPANTQRDAGSEIELYLTRTTATSDGLVTVNAGEKAGKGSGYLPLRLETNQSIFNVPGNRPLIQHTNMPESFSKSQTLVVKSTDSFFPLKNDLWEIGFEESEIQPETFDFSSVDEWLKITGAVGNTGEIAWKVNAAAEIPAGEQTVFDYELMGQWESNAAIRKKAGVDIAEFAPIPAAIID